ncbi:MAG: glycosyltransferase family 4 protein [Actinomycetota bacterium]|nr:glycosyltransferase family 4 protein [Actinomycetota bacterium]
MSPIRVGIVSPYDLSVPGGVQTQVAGLARYLNEQGDQAVVIGPGVPKGVEGVDLGPSVSIPGNGSMVPISIDPRARGKVRAAASDLDVLHVHEPLMPLASLFANHAGPPVVATFHAAPGTAGRLAYKATRPLFGWAMGNTVAITAVSETAASVLPPAVEVTIIPNGLDVQAMKVDTPRVQDRVAFLGRDERRKGLDVLLEAWPEVRAVRPDAELVVMGAARGTNDATWMGRVDERTKAEVLSSAAIYVAPQLGGESFGIVLLEAMAAGSAVVASDLEPFRSVAAEAARFFPVGDSAALAVTLLDLLGAPSQRAGLAAAGEERVAGYDWGVVGAAYRDLYSRYVS